MKKPRIAVSETPNESDISAESSISKPLQDSIDEAVRLLEQGEPCDFPDAQDALEEPRSREWIGPAASDGFMEGVDDLPVQERDL
jgi:hypothetical protein